MKLDILIARAAFYGGGILLAASVLKGCTALRQAGEAMASASKAINDNREATRQIFDSIRDITVSAGADYAEAIEKIKGTIERVAGVAGQVPDIWERVNELGNQLKEKLGWDTGGATAGGLGALILGRNYLSARDKQAVRSELERKNDELKNQLADLRADVKAAAARNSAFPSA